MLNCKSPFFIAVLYSLCVCPFFAKTIISDFKIIDPELEVTLWAETPLLYNPTNMDVDAKGRIWVTEGVNYRRSQTRKGGDRVVVLEDADFDGVAGQVDCFYSGSRIGGSYGNWGV
jgi:hypothetical protein